ncbi:MAG: FtsX-like permease family protein [Gemmatimonadales bacterium]|nr:FtsX-like permease family protein [Gemmatimonadales bacterium]
MFHDLWYVLRRLRLRPLQSAVIAVTLGLGLGAALAVFAIVDAVLLRPLPYDDAGRLVRVTQTMPVAWLPELPLSDVGFRRLASEAHTLAGAAAYATRDANLLGRGDARRLIVAQVTASLFPVLRVQPALGRGFSAEEDTPNGPRAVVLSDWLWRAAFGADPGVVGTVANLEGEPFTIVGVLPPGISFPTRQVGAWEPLRLDPAANNPFGRAYTVVARLKPRVTLAEAARDLTAPVQAVGREFPGPHAGSAIDAARFRANVRPLADSVVGDTKPVVVLLLAGVTLLLLLTCANVVNLQLAGVMARGEELAVRAALGATRARLVRGALLEGILLTAAGAALGLAVAMLGARLLATLMPDGIAIDGTLIGALALAVTVLAVLAVGATVGALPIALSAGQDPAQALRGRASGGGASGANRIRRLLAAAQVALAVLLLHGSGLLLSSAVAVQRVSLGFRPEGTMSLLFNLPTETLRDRAARETLLRTMLAEATRIPGVTSAGLVNALPLTPGRQDLAMAVEGRPFKADGTDPLADYRVVSAGYFETMGITVLRGRTFTDDDATAQSTPLVISEGLARELWDDGTDPVGRRLRFGPGAPWMPIIGVVADAKNRSLTEDSRPELYVPGLGTYSNLAFRSEIALVVRASAGASALGGPLRRAVAATAPGAAIYDVASLGDIVRDSRSRMTTATRLMSAYAVAALLLAVAGTYAVLSFLVAQRRREMAVRMALGATSREIVMLVGRESATLIGIGVAAGLLGAAATSRLLAGLLYGVGALDAAVVLSVVGAAAIAGVAAALLPALRATRVEPADALRAGA